MAQQSTTTPSEPDKPPSDPPLSTPANKPANSSSTAPEIERDEFGLPIRRHAVPIQVQEDGVPESPDRAGKVAQYVKKINIKAKEGDEEAIFPGSLGRKGSETGDGHEKRMRATSSSREVMKEGKVEGVLEDSGRVNGNQEADEAHGKQE